MISNWNIFLCGSSLAGHSLHLCWHPLWRQEMPSTPQPTARAVPRNPWIGPESPLAKDQCHICRPVLTISSEVIFPVCFCFFLSLGSSWRALMTRAEAGGTTAIWAFLFWMVSFTVILRPFQSPEALAISPSTAFGDRPRGPVSRARADVALSSPQVHFRCTALISSPRGGTSASWWGRLRWDAPDPGGPRMLRLSLLWARSRKLESSWKNVFNYVFLF